MKPQLIIFFALFFFLLSSMAYSQNTTYPILSMDIQTTATADSTTGGLPDFSDSTIFNVKMNVSLFDTTDIEKIYISLGDVGMPGNRLQQTFDWDVSGSTGNGTSYTRNKYRLTLNLGDYMNLLNYEAYVNIKRTDGTITDLINFSR